MPSPNQSKPQSTDRLPEPEKAVRVEPQTLKETAVEEASAAPTTADDPPIKIIDEAETVRLKKEEMERRLAASRTQEPEKAPETKKPETEFEKSMRPTTWPEFETAVLKAREPPPKPEYNPPQPTERQRTQLQEEIDAGRRRQQFHLDQKAAAPAAPVEEKLTVEVPRAGHYQNENPGGGK